MSFPVIEMLRDNFLVYGSGSYVIGGLILVVLLLLLAFVSRLPVYGVFFLLAPVIAVMAETGFFPLYLKAVVYLIAATLWFFAIMSIIGDR